MPCPRASRAATAVVPVPTTLSISTTLRFSGSGAEKAGLQSGDIITEFSGKKIMNMEQLVEILGAQKVGTTVKVHIIRNGESPMDLDVAILDANKVE